MNFTNLNTYGDSQERAFEALCNQLFERWIRREHTNELKYFTTVNGDGGDGGIEAYAILHNDKVIGVQAKWFPNSIGDSQIRQIRGSITTAKTNYQNLVQYIVCVPRNFSPKKKVKGGKTSKNYEEKRINDLKREIEKKYKDLTVKFWSEDIIREELQKPNNEGVLRFWFDKEELPIETLKNRFDLVKTGWLKERYTPSLHCQGVIQEKVEQVLFTPEHRKKKILMIEKTINETLTTTSFIDEFNDIAGSGNEFEKELNGIKENLTAYNEELLKLREAVKNGEVAHKPTEISEVEIWSTKLALQEKKLPNNFRNLLPRLVRALERSHQTHLNQYLSQVTEECKPHNIIVLGGPGTGKTHGVARAVENRLESDYPAIIIKAKGTPCANWDSIMHHTLGGLNHWSDSEIFSGLEALAVRKDQYRAISGDQSDNCNDESSNILICIDGIDESNDVKTWKDRINELEHWIKEFPRLRFVVTSRSYTLFNMNPCDLDFDDVNRRLDLPDEGDVPLNILVPVYLNEYEIKFHDTPWILGAFESALSLKLFCEEYQGVDLSSPQRSVSLGLGALLNAKIQRIEDEFFEKSSPDWSKTDQVIKKTLFHIAEILQRKEFIEHGELCKHIKNKFDGLIDRNWASKLLDTFASHGIILKRELAPDDGISPTSIDYTTAYQSYLDYFIAIKATKEIIDLRKKSLPDLLKAKYDGNSLGLTACSLLNDHDILVGEDDYWVDDFDNEEIHLLKYQALSSASDRVIKTYLPKVKDEFLASPKQRNTILVRFILPNLYRADLNLGRAFLHKMLIEFPNTFKRDLAWSGPDKYNGSEHLNIGVILSQYQLLDFHKHYELPLVFAWSLTSTNNAYREYGRSQLTEWGYQNPKEFVAILKLIFFCGDPQVQEDLACVMLGVASLINKPTSGLKELAEWVSTNIFKPTKIVSIKNSVVRYCARTIVERAYTQGECSEEEIQHARPNYTSDESLLPLDVSGERSGRGERFPIVHDLAWYVIDDSYRGFLDYRSGKETTEEGEELLQRYRDEYKQDFGPYEFAMSAGIAFIKNLGWDRENGPGMTEASHGSKSKLATLEEKYTWLAVHEIQGYLADLLPFKDDHADGDRLKDYGLLLHVPNPAKEFSKYANGFVRVLKDNWYVPEDISPRLNYTDPTLKQDIYNWVNRKSTPNFDLWINVEGLRPTGKLKSPDKWVSLYMDADLSEPNNIGRTSLELICCFIQKDKFDGFLDYFKKNIESIKWHFDDLGHLKASPKNNVYSSVKDVIWMNWIEEDYSDELFESGDGDEFAILKTVSKVVESSIKDGEQYFNMPSRYIRKYLNIVAGDQNRFIDNSGELTALFHRHGKAYQDGQQFLVVDRDKLNRLLEENKLVPFWIAFQIQTTSLELRRENQPYHTQNCRFWLVWQEDGQTRSFLYHDERFSNE